MSMWKAGEVQSIKITKVFFITKVSKIIKNRKKKFSKFLII